jgi:hypothetical protein
MDKLSDAIDLLNEVDDYGSSLVSKLSELDSKEQDLLHYIENNKISILWCYRMIRQIKTLREERRKVKHDMEILSRFNEVKVRITSRDNRSFILTELHKKEKQLHTTYKNRQYTDEDIEKIIKGDKE